MRPRTQAGLAVSGDGVRWALINASPDLRAQIIATPALYPRSGPRDSPIAAVVLTGAEIDQIAGLLTLRERQSFAIFATAETLARIDSNGVFDVLDRRIVPRIPIIAEAPFCPCPGVTIRAFPVPGKIPLFLEDKTERIESSDSCIGLEIASPSGTLAFVPAVAEISPPLRERLTAADVILLDGTLFTDNEMIEQGTGRKTGRRMGHMPIDGDAGSIAALAGLSNRRVFIHINNTNPILVEGSRERRQVEAAGWEVAVDGMEFEL